MGFIGKFLRGFGCSSEIPEPSGPYDVGVLPFRFPDSTFTKIFYPASTWKPSNSNSESKITHECPKKKYEAARKEIKQRFNYDLDSNGPYKYTRSEVIEGFSKWTKTSPLIFKYTVAYTKTNYEFLLDPVMDSKKFPVIIFSHGLGGNADIYSKMCSDLSSHGFVVIALEHEDGSGSYAFDVKQKKHIHYIFHPDGINYVRKEVVDYRKDFINKRDTEVKNLIKFLKGEDEKTIKNHHFKLHNDLEEKIFSMFDLEEMFFAGHSFGGATVVSLSHKEEYKSLFKAVVLFDLWPFPVKEEIENEGLKLPVMSIVSERFLESDEYKITRNIMKNSGSNLQFYIEGITHAQFSDAPWFTNLKYFKKKGDFEGKLPAIQSQKIMIEAVVDFLRNPTDFKPSHISDQRLIHIKHEPTVDKVENEEKVECEEKENEKKPNSEEIKLKEKIMVS